MDIPERYPLARTVAGLAAALTLLPNLACQPDAAPRADAGQAGEAAAVALVGGRIVDGTGGPVRENGVVLIRDGRIVDVSQSASELPAGTRTVDVGGSTIVPGLINAHGHVGGTRGLEAGHYTRDNLERQLRLYADYGVTTVLSLGGDGREGVSLRDAQNVSGLGRARLYVAGAVVTGETPEQAVEMVNDNTALGVDFMKIRVDDNLGTTRKMTPDVFGAVIDRTHEAGLPLAAHLFYREDAKALLRAGADLIAHSVRDQRVDQELIDLFVETGVCYVPTLTREVSTFVYADEPDFFADPFFLRHADREVLGQLLDPERQASVRDNPASARYREALAMAQENLGVLHGAGVTVAMGTDTGPPARFQGYFEHMELQLMVESGMSPEAVLRAATADAARCIGLDDVGTIEPGKWADLLVVDGDPLTDVSALRRIESVWIGGEQVVRP